MAFKRVTISLDEDVNKLWNKVTKKHRITKSGMIESYLRRVLYQLGHASIDEASNYDELLKIKEIEKGLFDLEYDQDIETYKKDKLG